MTDSLRVQVLNALKDLPENRLSRLLSVVVNVFNFLHKLNTLSQLHNLVDLSNQFPLEYGDSCYYVNVIKVLNNTELSHMLSHDTLVFGANALNSVWA
jgi:hypothetical protein